MEHARVVPCLVFANRGLFFEQKDFELRISLRELPGGRQADDSATDDRYLSIGHASVRLLQRPAELFFDACDFRLQAARISLAVVELGRAGNSLAIGSH